MAGKPAYLPVDLLWKYREFKRDEVPAPRIPFLNMYDVNQVTDYVRANGLKPVELSIIGNTALLTDGNHRIVAAKKLGYRYIPVYITEYSDNAKETFYEHTLRRFKQIGRDMNRFLSLGVLHSKEQLPSA